MANWDVTTAAAKLEFDTISGQANSCFQIDSNHFINFWSGSGVDGFVQVFTVNTTTWAVTTAAARLEFDTQNNDYNSCFKIDTNHFINFWLGGAATTDGTVQVFTVNTTTWAVTTAAALLRFDTDVGYDNSCAKIDTNHFINFWGGDSNGFVQVFTVNTTTWAVTTAAARLEFDTQFNVDNSCFQIDSNHFINFWSGPDSDGFVQVFTVNTTTWEVTTAAASLEFDTQNTFNSIARVDTNHFILFYTGVDTNPASGLDGYSMVFEVNTTTWAVTTASSVKLNFDTSAARNHSCYQIDSNHFINFWSDSALDGFVQVFTVEVPAPPGGTTVKDIINGTGIVPFAR